MLNSWPLTYYQNLPLAACGRLQWTALISKLLRPCRSAQKPQIKPRKRTSESLTCYTQVDGSPHLLSGNLLRSPCAHMLQCRVCPCSCLDQSIHVPSEADMVKFNKILWVEWTAVHLYMQGMVSRHRLWPGWPGQRGGLGREAGRPDARRPGTVLHQHFMPSL